MIPITRPLLGREEAAAAEAAILSGWLTQGREVSAFEHEFAAFVGAPYACAVSSCTAALHLALLAVGVRPGDEVITVSHSFIATANAIVYCGAQPVFVDIDPRTFNIDPKRIAMAITPHTKAILCVHQMGMPCDLQPILEIARGYRIPVIEDAACAVGSEISINDGAWEKIGRPHGDIACFSFHPRKVITTGEGGMLTTADPEWDRRFRLWRQHGMSVTDTARHGAKSVIFEDYPIVGFNYRMTDLQAAIGRQQLQRLPHILLRRRALAARLTERLSGASEIEVPRQPGNARTNWQSYCIRLRRCAGPQRSVMQAMLDRNVATRRGIMCAHLEPAYADLPLRFPLPNSERAQHETIQLPLYPKMSDEEQDCVVAALLDALAETRERVVVKASLRVH